MEKEIIKLKEWEKLKNFTFSKKSIEELMILQERSILKLGISKDGVELTANSYVGFESNEQFNIEVKPKISNFSILKMISFIHGFIPVNNKEDASLGEGKNTLQDLLIAQWIDMVERLTPKIRQNYVTIQDNEVYIKGKLLSKRLAKQGVLTFKTPVEYSVRKVDQPLNQIIKAGLNYFKNITINPYIINKINLHLRNYITITDILLTPNKLDKHIMGLTRLESDYKLPLVYLKWLLNITGLGKNNNIGKSLWINMNSLFQDYLVKFFNQYIFELRFESEVSNRTIFQYDKQANPLNKSSISIRPDLQVYYEDKLMSIVDFKYKNYSESTVSTSDLYQLSNYGLAVGHGKIQPIILYPTVDHVPDQVINVDIPMINPNQKIIIRSVNLSYLQELIGEGQDSQLSEYARKLLLN